MHKTLKFALATVLACVIAYGGMFWLLRNPDIHLQLVKKIVMAKPDRLRKDVEFLTAINPKRSFGNVSSLDAAASYIEAEFLKAGCEPERMSRETFNVAGDDYHNVICSMGPSDAPRIVIGAHYDVAGPNNPGADDNASGVAGLLETARLLKRSITIMQPSGEHREIAKYHEFNNMTHRVDLVAFTLEEPPNFKTTNMGSFFHAHNLAYEKADVKLMISLEMIGFFSDEPGSQDYPLRLLRLFYPDKGNFIGIVGHWSDRASAARVKSRMRSALIPVLSINAPAIVTGVDFSDHWSFWQNGIPAVMITDTSFLRNPNYHRETDTPDTLDYRRMGAVVDGVVQVAIGF